MIWWSFWWVSGFGLSFVYLLDILICIIRLFLFLEKSPCICKVKRFIFIIYYYLSGNIMWPVYLSQMWISRHTGHLSFFCVSCSCSSKHLKRLQLCTGGCLYYQVSDHFEKPMDGMQWNKCIGFEICICFKHVAILNSDQWTTWLEQNVLLTAGCGQSQCLRGPWLGSPCPGWVHKVADKLHL